MNHFFLDASAWIKRFHDEPGTDVVDHLVDHHVVLVAADRRLLRAATAEGLAVLDPEVSGRADIERLIG